MLPGREYEYCGTGALFVQSNDGDFPKITMVDGSSNTACRNKARLVSSFAYPGSIFVSLGGPAKPAFAKTIFLLWTRIVE